MYLRSQLIIIGMIIIQVLGLIYLILEQRQQVYIYNIIEFDLTITLVTFQIAGLGLRWIAVDDDRFQFLKSFNNDVSDGQAHSFIFPRTNPNLNQGFVGIMNFNLGQNGPINFRLSMTLNANDVIVDLTQTTNNLLSLGVFVVLGTSDVFNLGELTTLNNLDSTTPYIKTMIPPSESLLLLPYQSLEYDGYNSGDTFRIRILLTVNGDSSITWTVKTWSYCLIKSISFQQLFMSTASFAQKPTTINKFRCSRMWKSNQNQLISLYLKDFGITLIPNAQIQKQTISIQNYQMIISMFCRLSTYVEAQFFLCSECDKKYKFWKQQCYAGINLIQFNVNLNQYYQVSQNFDIEISSTELKVIHQVPSITGITPYLIIKVQLKEV